MKTALIFLAVVLSIYCMAAFVTWEANPAEWGFVTRFLAAMFAFFMAPIIAMEAKT